MTTERVSNPNDMRVRLSWVQSILSAAITAAAVAGAVYMGTIIRIEQLEQKDEEFSHTLDRVTREARDERVGMNVRITQLQVADAVREAESRTTNRAIESLTLEIRNLREELSRRR